MSDQLTDRLTEFSSDHAQFNTVPYVFAFLDSGFTQMFGQIAFIRVKTLNSTNFVVSRHIKREENSLPVAPLQ